MPTSRRQQCQLSHNCSKVSVLMSRRDNTKCSLKVDSSHRQISTRLRQKTSGRPVQTSSGLGRAKTSRHASLQVSRHASLKSKDLRSHQRISKKKTIVECRKRDERIISLTETDKDRFFSWQWHRLCFLTGKDVCYSPKECNNYEQLLSGPQAIETLYLHLKAKAAGSSYWANQFLLLVGRNLDVISKDPDFLCLDQITVCNILRSDFLDVPQEKAVFNAGYRWIRADFDYRLQHANEILSCPRYALMTPEDIVRSVFSCRPLTDIILDIPRYPQAILRGIIGKYLLDLHMTSYYTGFEVRNRTKDDPCRSTNYSMSGNNSLQPVQNKGKSVCSWISVRACHK